MAPTDEPRGGDRGVGWDGGWEAHARRRRRAWLRSTPAQRLRWLEEAVAFAARAGALPRRTPVAGGRDPREDAPRGGAGGPRRS